MRDSKLRRVVVGVLIGLVVVLAGGMPVAAVDAPNSLNGLEATYDVTAAIKWRKKRLNVSSTALVTNNSDVAVTALTFNAAPAKIGQMILGDVTVGGEAASATLDDQNIIVTLPIPTRANPAGGGHDRVRGLVRWLQWQQAVAIRQGGWRCQCLSLDPVALQGVLIHHADLWGAVRNQGHRRGSCQPYP